MIGSGPTYVSRDIWRLACLGLMSRGGCDTEPGRLAVTGSPRGYVLKLCHAVQARLGESVAAAWRDRFASSFMLVVGVT